MRERERERRRERENFHYVLFIIEQRGGISVFGRIFLTRTLEGAELNEQRESWREMIREPEREND